MKKKNLAAILTKQKEKLKILNLDLPNVPKNYVLVKMKFSGICHTQLNEISGILGKDRFIPHCMGHEGVGEIIFTGIGIIPIVYWCCFINGDEDNNQYGLSLAK